MQWLAAHVYSIGYMYVLMRGGTADVCVTAGRASMMCMALNDAPFTEMVRVWGRDPAAQLCALTLTDSLCSLVDTPSSPKIYDTSLS